MVRIDIHSSEDRLLRAERRLPNPVNARNLELIHAFERALFLGRAERATE
jgi:hypothetical protein